MKVDMALMRGSTPAHGSNDGNDADDMDADVVDAGPGEPADGFDESDRHSKIKTFLLVAAMIGGLGLFVWNMTGLVNNMRLDNQGYAVNVVHEDEEIRNFMGSSDGSAAVGMTVGTGAAADAADARDGPAQDGGGAGQAMYHSESGTVDTLRQEVKEANNTIALLQQELRNADDMLGAMQEQLDGLSGEN